MYYLYIDESGDTGLVNSPSRYFALTGLVIHETNWTAIVNDLVVFRRNLRVTHGLKVRAEIHANPFVQHGQPLSGTPRHVKLYILRQCIDWLASRNDVHVITVVIDKQGKPPKYNVFEQAWQVLIQRFENTIQHKNFPGGFSDQQGMIIPDNTDAKKLTGLLRKMRHFNAVPSQSFFCSARPVVQKLTATIYYRRPLLQGFYFFPNSSNY
ncbi:DUF3800 domain-containing protein [Hymenobacter sp. NBH84]|uniref:DUF3800 domain-containing protein n=1 Tax=Hymenobacter sp. NBH84 TaxID=2596915 RepID=UPI0016251898|nr:DUF3800 domain-containing protein [Hymenobacter sp. NBH84]QNE40894.1 DUF3800 domain-containing protein [Hymenobacter sp. NBH84]